MVTSWQSSAQCSVAELEIKSWLRKVWLNLTQFGTVWPILAHFKQNFQSLAQLGTVPLWAYSLLLLLRTCGSPPEGRRPALGGGDGGQSVTKRIFRADYYIWVEFLRQIWIQIYIQVDIFGKYQWKYILMPLLRMDFKFLGPFKSFAIIFWKKLDLAHFTWNLFKNK